MATRNGFGEGLKKAGEKNDAVVALCADLTESTRTHLFKEAFPERFVQVGVAEQNMASVASGMSAMGRIPFISSYAMFSPGRNWEQIRTTIAYNNSNVKVVGAHAGVSVGPDGATHQAIEDIALMRVMPNMTVVAPGDALEAEALTIWASEYEGPVYMRLGREKTPIFFNEAVFSVDGVEVLEAGEPPTVVIISTGTLTYEALQSAKILTEEGYAVSVLHMPCIKPLDTACIDKALRSAELLVTVEEHQRIGGLGSAVAEYVSEVKPTKIVRIGVDDQFGQSGTPAELLAHYKLDQAGILEIVRPHLS